MIEKLLELGQVMLNLKIGEKIPLEKLKALV
jgi:hypothetical protein